MIRCDPIVSVKRKHSRWSDYTGQWSGRCEFRLGKNADALRSRSECESECVSILCQFYSIELRFSMAIDCFILNAFGQFVHFIIHKLHSRTLALTAHTRAPLLQSINGNQLVWERLCVRATEIDGEFSKFASLPNSRRSRPRLWAQVECAMRAE